MNAAAVTAEILRPTPMKAPPGTVLPTAAMPAPPKLQAAVRPQLPRNAPRLPPHPAAVRLPLPPPAVRPQLRTVNRNRKRKPGGKSSSANPPVNKKADTFQCLPSPKKSRRSGFFSFARYNASPFVITRPHLPLSVHIKHSSVTNCPFSS